MGRGEGKVCDNCQRPPVEFKIEGSGETGWWFRVAKEGGAAVLMDDLEFAFCATTDKEPSEDDEHYIWCNECMNAHLEEME